MKSRMKSKYGFTLIEVIITIVLVAIVAAMMTAYFGTSITQSSLPIFRLSNTGKLNAIMEKITAEYEQIPRWSAGKTYTTAGSVVIPTLPSAVKYKYSASVGTCSTTTEPAWTPSGAVPLDGSVTWTNIGLAPTPTDLQTSINTHQNDTFFGDNYVATTKFITFNTTPPHAGTEADPAHDEDITSNPSHTDYGKYLKVTIAFTSGEQLTTLFVRR